MKKYFNSKVFFILSIILISISTLFIIIGLVSYSKADDIDLVNTNDLAAIDQVGRYVDLSFDLGSPQDNNYFITVGNQLIDYDAFYANASESLDITYNSNLNINYLNSIWSLFDDLAYFIESEGASYSYIYGSPNLNSFPFISFSNNITYNVDMYLTLAYTFAEPSQVSFDFFDNTNNHRIIRPNPLIDFFTLTFNLWLDITEMDFYFNVELYGFSNGVLVFDGYLDDDANKYNNLSIYYESSNSYDLGYNNGKDDGYLDGYTKGYNKGSSDTSGAWGVLFTAFVSTFKILNIEIFPGVTFGILIAFPLMLGLMSFVFGVATMSLKSVSGKDEDSKKKK